MEYKFYVLQNSNFTLNHCIIDKQALFPIQNQRLRNVWVFFSDQFKKFNWEWDFQFDKLYSLQELQNRQSSL